MTVFCKQMNMGKHRFSNNIPGSIVGTRKLVNKNIIRAREEFSVSVPGATQHAPRRNSDAVVFVKSALNQSWNPYPSRGASITPASERERSSESRAFTKAAAVSHTSAGNNIHCTKVNRNTLRVMDVRIWYDNAISRWHRCSRLPAAGSVAASDERERERERERESDNHETSECYLSSREVKFST